MLNSVHTGSSAVRLYPSVTLTVIVTVAFVTFGYSVLGWKRC